MRFFVNLSLLLACLFAFSVCLFAFFVCFVAIDISLRTFMRPKTYYSDLDISVYASIYLSRSSISMFEINSLNVKKCNRQHQFVLLPLKLLLKPPSDCVSLLLATVCYK